jgi:hypothetical protein
MLLRRSLWLMWFVLGLWLSACAGGSGSSGFDNFPSSENAAIQTALDDQRCVSFHRLSICPADTTTGLPTAATPTSIPSATPTIAVFVPTPGITATATPTHRATFTAPPSATPTPTPPAPRVDTGINDGAVSCAPAGSDSGCIVALPFAPEGFPLGTVFRVALRTVDPASAWTIGPDPISSGSPSAPAFEAAVAVNASTNASDTKQRVQLAVLAFLASPKDVPTTVAILDDSGADYAFVTADLSLQAAAGPGVPK